MDNPTLALSAVDVDTLTIDAVVNALYASISGPAGERDWVRLRGLFMPHATLAAVTPVDASRASLAVRTVSEFIEGMAPHMRAHEYHETEISRRVERFGNIAHVFSTYEVRQSAAPAFSRGINSLQLFSDGQRWWISAMLWDTERLGAMLPDVYLEHGTG